MIILNVTYKCKPDMREEFLNAIMAEGIDDACRAEAGNIKYDYFRAVDDSDELLLSRNGRTPRRLQRMDNSHILQD